MTVVNARSVARARPSRYALEKRGEGRHVILCAGEALIDMLPGESSTGTPAFLPHAGGAVFNTALALGRLGAPAGWMGGLSGDPFGRTLERTLREARVSVDHAVRSDRPTTLALLHMKGKDARYTFYDDGTAGRMLDPADLPDSVGGISAVFAGGISLASEPCGTAFEAFVTRMAPDVAVMIDPNIRPAFVTDDEGYRERLARLFALADIVKVSGEDLEWLFGPGHVEERAGEILAMGPRLVFITDGGAGARAYTASHEVILGAETVTVVDTVAAGDAFNAGALAELQRAGLLSKEALTGLAYGAVEAALSLAIRVAGITVSRRGANPPWSDEI